MKKIIFLIIFVVTAILFSKIDYGYKVFEVKTPNEIYIDLNKNLIFDEKYPVVVQNLHYVNSNTDLKQYPVLQQLTEDEKFFLEYKAKETADNILKNRYVKVKSGDIFIQNKSYLKSMLNSKFAFDNTKKSQVECVNNIKSINLDDYVILNLKSKKYHKLNCELGRKSLKYKIVKRSAINKKSDFCKICHLPEAKQILNIKQKNTISSGDIKIFFIDLNKVFKPDNSCIEEACKNLKQEIDNSKHSIDIALYGINNQPKIIQALINAKNRGVKIRRVYDYSKKKYYKDNEKLDKILQDFITDENYDKTYDSALMHNKYFIFDNQKIWTGTSNISSTDLSGFNSNYTVIIKSKEIAEKYKEDFEQMYNGIFHKSKKTSNAVYIQLNKNTKIKPMFSPQDNIINSEIIPLINLAQKYIYSPVFFITHKGIEEALINAHNRGVEVKIINDATNAHTKYTIHQNLREAGIKVKTENYAGKMHSKAIIIDDKYTIIGSMNYTKSGNSKNDENILIIENNDIAKYMKTTFRYLWKKIPDKYEKFDPKAESKDSIGSCSDGIDNDFDDKIDKQDEGCF